MELKHIDIGDLAVSAANMRAKGAKPDIGNILPSVRARGVLVPLIVRPAKDEGRFEIVAGNPIARVGLEVGDDALQVCELLFALTNMFARERITRWTRATHQGLP